MKNVWTLLCCVVLAAALTACKSSEPAPAEGEPATEAEAPAEKAEADEKEATTQKIVAQGSAPGALPAPPDVAAPPENAEKSESGLAWTVLQAGTGDKKPTAADIVKVNYTGWTTAGRMFDSSVVRGQPAEFPLNRVIRGWTEGVQMMVAGEKRRFWIPGSLAYGEAAPNDPHAAVGPPRGTLVFDVELISFKELSDRVGLAKDRGGPNGFVRFLRVLAACVVRRLLGKILVAVLAVDQLSCFFLCFSADARCVSSHIRNETNGSLFSRVHAFVERLRDSHGASCRETKLSSRFLLQFARGERRYRKTSPFLAFDLGNGECGAFKVGEDAFRFLVIPDPELFFIFPRKLCLELRWG